MKNINTKEIPERTEVKNTVRFWIRNTYIKNFMAGIKQNKQVPCPFENLK